MKPGAAKKLNSYSQQTFNQLFLVNFAEEISGTMVYKINAMVICFR